MNIYTRKIPPTELDDKQKRSLMATLEYQEVATESPFLYLTCDLPPPPLFIDEFRENIIPQVNFNRCTMSFATRCSRLVKVLVYYTMFFFHWDINPNGKKTT